MNYLSKTGVTSEDQTLHNRRERELEQWPVAEIRRHRDSEMERTRKPVGKSNYCTRTTKAVAAFAEGDDKRPVDLAMTDDTPGGR